MNWCERCQPLVLDHLYGLLDGPDAAFVEAHLRECASCAATRDEAARVAGLFAQAARGAFPQVRFETPASEPAQLSEPAAPAAPAAAASTGRSWRVNDWLPWAVAAAVWLAIPGTVLPVLNILHRADRTQADADRSMSQLEPKIAEADKARLAIDEPRNAARRNLAARSQHLDAVLAKWLNTESEALARARRSPVDVLKPASLQPGAPNEFDVFVHDGLAGGHTQLTAEIHEVRGTGAERTDAVILSQPLKAHHYEAQPLRLPASAWSKLTPQSELYLAVTCTDERTRAKTEIQERVRLFGPVFTTMLATDKPTYRPGETLFFRSLTLDRITFRPPDREQKLQFELFERDPALRLSRGKLAEGGTDLVRVVGGKVEPVLVNGKPIRGVGCGSFVLPSDLPDGDYSLVLRELPLSPVQPAMVPTPTVRSIKVQSTPNDIHKKNIVLLGRSFAPGDTVRGYAELTLQGQPVAGAEVQAIATADGVRFDSIQAQPKTGPDGKVNLQFTLPRQLDRGDVRLQVTFKSTVGREVVQEIVTDRVPVVGRQVKVEFFPEGGDLVAGAPCRVYFRATTPDGQAVDIRGTITDGRRTIAKVETLTDAIEGTNRGVGSFTFTPEIGTPVWLKLDAPARMSAPLIPDSRTFLAAPVAAGGGLAAAATARTGFLLPPILNQGVVMTVLDPVTTPGQPIRVHLRSVGTTRKLIVGAYTRGRLSDSQPVTIEPNQVSEVRLMANTDPRGGVVRITVFEEPPEAELLGEARSGPKPDVKPVAERLVFRKPGDLLNLGFTTTGVHAPGSPIELNITATDEKGHPAAAVLYAAAVNTGIRPGQKDRLLTTHFLIAGEITTPDAIEFADFLLTDHPRAAESLDMVLATQGWRRFAEQIPAGYVRRPTAPSEEWKNLLVSNGQYSVWADPIALREQRKLQETFWPQYEAAKSARDAARVALAAANADRSAEDRAQALADEVEAAHAESRALRARADTAATTVERFRKAGWYGVAGFGLLALLLGATGLFRPDARLPLGVGTAGALGLVAFLVFAIGSAERTQAASVPMAKIEADRSSVKKEIQDATVAAAATTHDDGAKLAAGAVPAMNGAMKGDLATPGAAVLAKGSGPATTIPQQSVPQRSFAAPLARMAFGAVPQHPLLPNVESGRAEGMTGAARFGLGVSGGPSGPLGGGMGGGFGGFGKLHEMGFFGRWPYFLQPMEPAPAAPTAIPPAPGDVRPNAVARGAGGFGGKTSVAPKSNDLVRRSATFPKITIEDRIPSEPAVPAPPAMAAGSGLAAPMRYGTKVSPATTIHQRGSGNTTVFETDHARTILALKDFTDLRVESLSEELVEYMARRGMVPLELLKESLETAKKDNGWSVGPSTKGGALPPNEVQACARILQSIPRLQSLVVREYAAPRLGSDSNADMPDTILWQPVIVLPADGKARVAFHLGNAPGGYEVVVAGHTLDGRLGAVRGVIPVLPVQPREAATPTVRPGQAPPVPPSGPPR